MAQQLFTVIMNLFLLTAIVLLVTGITRKILHKKSVNLFLSMVLFAVTAILAFFCGAATSPVVRQDETLSHRLDSFDVGVLFIFTCLMLLTWFLFYFFRLRKK